MAFISFNKCAHLYIFWFPKQMDHRRFLHIDHSIFLTPSYHSYVHTWGDQASLDFLFEGGAASLEHTWQRPLQQCDVEWSSFDWSLGKKRSIRVDSRQSGLFFGALEFEMPISQAQGENNKRKYFFWNKKSKQTNFFSYY